jgi:outer membrane lipoprotein-sorting protein
MLDCFAYARNDGYIHSLKLYGVALVCKTKNILFMRIIICLAILLLKTSTVWAEVDATALIEFKSYLGSLKSVAIDFEQEDHRGAEAQGTLVIVKPEKFACNYYAPYPLFIAGNKSYLSVYDFDLEQLTRVDANDNMFNFLLTSKVDIEKHFTINKATKTNDEIEVELYHQESDRTTSILLDLKPLKLKSIITGESDGNVITLHIGNIIQIKDVDDKLFILKNPDIYGKPERLDRTQLAKKYKVL